MLPYRKLRGKLRVITVTLPALRTLPVLALDGPADKSEWKTPSMEGEGKGDGHQYG